MSLDGQRDRLRKAVVWLTGALHDESPEHAGKSHVECDVWECIRARTVLAETADTRRTPTPQERTELQRLAEALELAGNVADEAWQMGLNVRAAKKLASALLSLAAQSEELRAELEKKDMVNEQYFRAMGTFKAQRDDLESRYTALEKALQHFLTLTREFHPGDTPDDAVWLVPDSQLRTLSAALTPKEGE